MVSASPFIHQSDRVQRRASDVSATDWRYQTHVENYPNFRRVLLGLFSGPGNPCKTAQVIRWELLKVSMEGKCFFLRLLYAPFFKRSSPAISTAKENCEDNDENLVNIDPLSTYYQQYMSYLCLYVLLI